MSLFISNTFIGMSFLSPLYTEVFNCINIRRVSAKKADNDMHTICFSNRNRVT